MSSIENRDYTLIIDKSGSMSTREPSMGNMSRWLLAKECAIALANKCEELDPDGITIYLFSGRFKRYDNQTAQKIDTLFKENDPSGSTDLAGVLKDATDNFLRRKAAGQAKGETILVLTDGEPNDRKAVMKVIIEASRRLDADEELAISLIQIGSDADATRFLKALDDDLEGAGAKFDIVDTVTLDDMENMTLREVLLNAIND